MNDNVVHFPGDKREPPDVLASTPGADIEQVMVLGFKKNGGLYMAFSSPAYADNIWLIECAKAALLNTAFER